jgi:uncharacterized membrane protein
MTETLLVIHVLAAVAWIGGGLFSGFVGPRMAKAGGETAINWIRTATVAATRYFMPAGVITLLSGIGVVLSDEAYDFAAPFVGVGLAVAVIALVLGMTVNRPSAIKALAAAEAGDFPSVGVHARRAGLTWRIVVILLILTEIAMVLRLGA